jgi:hypothetical protein
MRGYRTTTEVYPDSPRATPEQCNDAQVAAVRAAIGFAAGASAREVETLPGPPLLFAGEGVLRVRT